MIEVNHLQAHILANFIKEPGVESRQPSFPFLTLLVSGGNSQLIVVHDYLKMEMIGQTIDDAAGEAFDKCAKVMGLPYPGGPIIDRLAKEGNPERFTFNKPQIPGLDYSFSGLKTSFLYSFSVLFTRPSLGANGKLYTNLPSLDVVCPTAFPGSKNKAVNKLNKIAFRFI